MLIRPALAAGSTAYVRLYQQEHHQAGVRRRRRRRSWRMRTRYVLDERLLKLGMIWQVEGEQGLALRRGYGQRIYDALAMKMGHDQPAPMLIGKATDIARRSTPASPIPGRCRQPMSNLRRVPPAARPATVRAEPADGDAAGADPRHHPVRERRIYAPGGAIVADNWVPTLARRQAARRHAIVLRPVGGAPGWDVGQWDIAKWDDDHDGRAGGGGARAGHEHVRVHQRRRHASDVRRSETSCST